MVGCWIWMRMQAQVQGGVVTPERLGSRLPFSDRCCSKKSRCDLDGGGWAEGQRSWWVGRRWRGDGVWPSGAVVVWRLCD
ncbi:hypothetical protein RchiOBHm_Chr1g0321961 [Rosa chinensis]|uniref:Uncharacterized protein n=1 Tax=Rosa chinensis TaxID=74649 RepID=A0A2P6S929_ROSCH|nr:hypothetical protein RchiOBHm_Chr1g0321961 [Rosa chinensis]